MPIFKLKWTEKVLMTVEIQAESTEEAEAKFYAGDRGEPDWLDSNMLDDDLEIKELKEEE
ncbi:hypothetical protein [Listeria newyorkensis]|uniref:hypothetical protein n=1 Tax=Listeria newyorkensis TaxID=1497681 RepID=UPI00051CC1A0|nr:hypothetical protein [Listeria newyorkensis]KGL45715.1 hypothetical protein EP58_03210 [Listeria newyorkensis]SQC55353.1 Uncharacterised protein [Listeria newyorkensis]